MSRVWLSAWSPRCSRSPARWRCRGWLAFDRWLNAPLAMPADGARQDRDPGRSAVLAHAAGARPSAASSIIRGSSRPTRALTGARDARIRAGEYDIAARHEPAPAAGPARVGRGGTLHDHRRGGLDVPRPASRARERPGDRADAGRAGRRGDHDARSASRASQPRACSSRIPTVFEKGTTDLDDPRQAQRAHARGPRRGVAVARRRTAARDRVRGAGARLDRREGDRACRRSARASPACSPSGCALACACRPTRP